ncbi:MAG: ABC transporter ATP-binding protein [candidate division Zixibacteria bacterium]|nr:ABC transporter ATP-binding protein [candidate division Zixibacteria bacterium]
MSDAVTINKLTKKFGDFTAVDQISLNVGEGEVFGFLGANGAGKTTAIRMLCGLLLPTSGNGTVGGYDIYRDNENIKKTIGYMSQKFSLYGDLTAYENLWFYGSVYQIKKKVLKDRINELSDELGLKEFLDRPSENLPLGWRQRLALAASVLHRPKILFLDEPTGGVDPVFRRRFWGMLYDLADKGTTLFVTTHYMDEAEYCHRISIMHHGKIVELGNPAELIKKHQQPNLEELFVQLISMRDGISTDV